LVATLNPEAEHAGETLSTVKFAQRCAEVAAEGKRNEWEEGGEDVGDNLEDLQNEVYALRKKAKSSASRAAKLDAALAAERERWAGERAELERRGGGASPKGGSKSPKGGSKSPQTGGGPQIPDAELPGLLKT
jgi:septal ring factor EnvC (AmiA/AmiB activator)